MVLIVGSYRVPVDRLDDFIPDMEEMVTCSRSEEGCQQYSYSEDIMEEGLIRVIEAWDDAEALERHIRSAHMHEWRAKWPRVGVSDRMLETYDFDWMKRQFFAAGVKHGSETILEELEDIEHGTV